jgi:dihydroorotate dehydrogenase
MLSRLAYHAAKLLPPETAHDLGKQAMTRGLLAGDTPPSRPTELFGHTLPNPLGLAAGFDKNGELLHVIHRYGFGFEEVGSLTFRGGPGNPRPRLFRVGENLMNRLGLNGDPAEVVAARLRKSPTPFFGVNVAKTHDPQIIGDAGIEDVVGTVRLVHDLGLYTVLNVSCPNTREGKTFEEPEALAELLAAVNAVRDEKSRPLCVKLSPLLSEDDHKLAAVVDVCEAAGVAGYVACNTLPVENKHGRGGMSGDAVRLLAIRLIRRLRQDTNKPILGVGGIKTPAHLRAYLWSGATAVQVYNGFVRGPFAGPRFAFDLQADGVSNSQQDP